MNLKPLGKRVVIKKVEAQEKTKSGIVLPGQVKEQPQVATVVAVGDEDLGVKIGDRIVFSKFSGTEIKIDDVEYTILDEDALLAIIE
ncbi:MAG: molecular chaperone GroES [delta proteobacterium ML8_F1]|nr:MAG: molecular chaperone GroES [delta proteobacterium ML8_F1]